MLAIKDAESGRRFFMYCVMEGAAEKKLKTLKSALIAHILSEGHELLNKQGVKKPNHTVTFLKNNPYRIE